MAAEPEIDTQNIAWARNKGGFGFKMLQKMGWSEGKGLGKNEDGRVKHVKVALRADNVGIGLNDDKTGNDTLKKGFTQFANVLDTLKAHHGKAGPASKTGNAAVASGHKIAYTKVLRNKDVSSYSRGDLAAILGLAAHETPFVPIPSISAAQTAGADSDSSSGSATASSTQAARVGGSKRTREEGGASADPKAARKAAKAAKKAKKEKKAKKAKGTTKSAETEDGAAKKAGKSDKKAKKDKKAKSSKASKS